MMGRRRMYTDATERKRANRARQHGPRDIVTQPQGENTRRHDIKGLVAPVRASHGSMGGVYQHTAAAGLLVRVDGELTGGRVLATVLSPGQSNLTAGTAYPFRVDLLNEVHP